ncbi:HEPN domain-containing protein [Enterovibrio calviensis]|uniref:HEPN domain-containing protein n=1 Tax=Enterovibrio calviensis TaxID=91359 RepID=UPI00373525DA
MNDFFKTKVGFTIGLLAAVFAFKPLVDSNSDVGFVIFEVKLTIEHAYIFITAFLGVAVYFISLQFASAKHLNFLDTISNACYTTALATPPVYFFLWLLVKSAAIAEQYIDKVTPFTMNVVSSALAGIFANIFVLFVSKSMKSKFSESEKKMERNENIELMAKSKELMNIGMYDMSVLECSKVVESLLKRLLESKGIKIEKGTMLELISLSKTHKILSQRDIEVFHEIRRKRNESVHAMDVVTKEDAQKILHLSRELIIRLDSVSSSTGYEWLESHRSKVIEGFINGDEKKSLYALAMLKEAWVNRDGAVWLELSEFFETILVYKPSMLLAVFKDDDALLDSWLDRIEGQLFTDFLGGEIERLKGLKMEAITSLEAEIERCDNQKDLRVFKNVLERVEQAQIRAVE